MADILLDFPINAPIDRVFQGVSAPAGLDTWWTSRASGTPYEGALYELWFAPEYDWRAVVTRCMPGADFELELTEADRDWLGTRVRVRLERRDATTWVRFEHTGWPAVNEHFRISCNCWAMYLRVLRRSLEYGEMVAYEDRLA